jgi:hypothetical protein
LFQQEKVQIQPAIPEKMRLEAVSKKTEIKEQRQTDDPNYFSKHVERVEREEESIVAKNKSTEPLTFSIKKPWQKLDLQKQEMLRNADESIFMDTTIPKITPEIKEAQKITPVKNESDNREPVPDKDIIPVKKQVITLTPLIEKAAEVKNNHLRNNPKIERLRPAQPEMDLPQKQQHNHPNQQPNKLVIGKIIVEILPPKQPLPQKVITRVVQSSPKDSFPTSNKLSFGLGQL